MHDSFDIKILSSTDAIHQLYSKLYKKEEDGKLQVDAEMLLS